MTIDTYVLPGQAQRSRVEILPPADPEEPKPITLEQIKTRLFSLSSEDVAELLRTSCEAQWQEMEKKAKEQGYKAGVQRAEQMLAEELRKVDEQKKLLSRECEDLKSELSQVIELLAKSKPTFDEESLIGIVAEGCIRLVGEQLVESDVIKARVQALVDKYQRKAMTKIAIDKNSYTLLQDAELAFDTEKVALVADEQLEKGSINVSFEHGEMEHSVRKKAEEFFQLIDPSYQVVRR